MSDVSHKIAVWLDEIRSEQVKNTIFFFFIKGSVNVISSDLPSKDIIVFNFENWLFSQMGFINKSDVRISTAGKHIWTI